MNNHSLHIGRPITTRRLSEDNQTFIVENYEKLSVKTLADKFGVNVRTVYRFLDEKGLRSLDTTRGKSKGVKKKSEIPEGYFDYSMVGDDIMFKQH